VDALHDEPQNDFCFFKKIARILSHKIGSMREEKQNLIEENI